MTATPAPADQEIIEILKKLETLKAEYPPDLFAARRAAFIAQIDEHKQAELRDELASETQVAEALGSLKKAVPEYPSELFAARRAAFLTQVKQQKEIQRKEALASRVQVMGVLERLKNAPAEYPPKLLAARRAAFLAEIEQYNKVEAVEELPVESPRLIRLFDRLKAVEIEYPLKLWTVQRTAFLKQISRNRLSVLDTLRSGFQNILDQLRTSQASRMRLMRSSLIMAGLLLAAFIGTLLYGTQGSTLLSPSPEQSNASQPVVATSTTEAEEVICKPGYLPPLCLAQESNNKAEDLTYQGNGSARPAVAKDTLPGYSNIHKAAYVNDGLYGAGASWISNSAYSWIKIDLGKPTTINTITFGRDRLGNYNDRDPGQFVIAVALHDDVYADGNSSNDSLEYTKVYDSKQMGFDGIVSGAETIQASFAPVEARFVKITFENAGAAVDEVEAFMIQPSSLAYIPTEKSRDNQPRPTSTPIPTNTFMPTSTPTPVPTDTPLPTSTPTPVPTDTPLPTSTPTEVPTSTPRPTHTPTDVPTNTPRPTSTPTPRPTSTPTDVPTNTPRPTSTPTDVPTNTPRPTSTPTDVPTNTPFPTDTPMPPTDTPVPVQPTDTTGPLIAPTNTPFPTDTPFVTAVP